MAKFVVSKEDERFTREELMEESKERLVEIIMNLDNNLNVLREIRDIIWEFYG